VKYQHTKCLLLHGYCYVGRYHSKLGSPALQNIWSEITWKADRIPEGMVRKRKTNGVEWTPLARNYKKVVSAGKN
jgi:hypothetical protein